MLHTTLSLLVCNAGEKNVLWLSHVASTAAGNAGVPVVVNGFDYGRASGMAPRARCVIIQSLMMEIVL